MDNSITTSVPVYVVDTGVDTTHAVRPLSFHVPVLAAMRTLHGRDEEKADPHKDFYHPNYPQPFTTRINAVADEEQRDVDGHGTGMAGHVAGAVAGVYKNAEIIPVKVLFDDGVLNAWRLVVGLQRVIANQHERHNPPCVISMSINFEPQQIDDPMIFNGRDALRPIIERLLPDSNAVVTISAGNLPDQEISARYPRAYGGSQTDLIVVGAADANGIRLDDSSWLDSSGRGILSLYVMATQVIRPNIDPENPYTFRHGTSSATAMAAGMAARLLAKGVAPARVKATLQSEGLRLKGRAFPSDDDGWFAPRAAIDNQVACAQPLQGAVVPTPTYTATQGYEDFALTASPVFQTPNPGSATCYNVTAHAPAVLQTELFSSGCDFQFVLHGFAVYHTVIILRRKETGLLKLCMPWQAVPCILRSFLSESKCD